FRRTRGPSGSGGLGRSSSEAVLAALLRRGGPPCTRRRGGGSRGAGGGRGRAGRADAVGQRPDGINAGELALIIGRLLRGLAGLPRLAVAGRLCRLLGGAGRWPQPASDLRSGIPDRVPP